MEDRDKIFDELSRKLVRLEERHRLCYEEIKLLRAELEKLKLLPSSGLLPGRSLESPTQQAKVQQREVYQVPKPTEGSASSTSGPLLSDKFKESVEDFIGTNLLNKIGIAVLVIGIAFGTKYAIDHELLSPLTRIVLGYLAGSIIIGFAVQLKKKYKSFSAVLLSGGMAALYFVTYIAYASFDLMPQGLAFGVMVMFTVFTAFAAIQYNLQVVAIIGFVGAYGVPFLLGNGSGRVEVLYAYMTMINVGILVLAFTRYWKKLYYLAFVLTWIIFASWYGSRYDDAYFWLCLGFSTIFFALFHVIFLGYRLLRSEALHRADIVFIMLNSFLYFYFGYATIESRPAAEPFLGLFTVFVALVHFIAAVVIYRQQRGDSKDIFYLVAGLVLIFITLAVPVQLDGNWVTLVWSAEAALLFWIGRTKGLAAYEGLSYVLLVIAVVSLLQDWDGYYSVGFNYKIESHQTISIFFNIQFFTSLWVIGALIFVMVLMRNKNYVAPFAKGMIGNVAGYGIPVVLGLLVYCSFFKEIDLYWSLRYWASMVGAKDTGGDGAVFNADLLPFKRLWLINYSAMFGCALAFVNYKFLNSKTITRVSLGFNAVVIVVFLMLGLVELARLRTSYMEVVPAGFYDRGLYHLVIRYISMLFIVPLVWCNYAYVWKTSVFDTMMQKTERVFFYVLILTLLSSELVHWLDLMQVNNSFKLALSILWGVYALVLIVIGLAKNQKFVRVAAIVLFAVTLAKLFVYDMAGMSTIAKTVVMLILGILLLTSSFLYNKFKRKRENV